jgi:non-specific serine/threonine protein kinase
MERRTAFVGREREIAEVRSLLEGTRLLTMTGPGGIGKTRLATQAIAPASAEGLYLVVVELASVSDPDHLLPAIGAAMGLRESSAVDAVHVLSERLGRHESLLLLDNFEQIASAGPTVGTLLDATPSLRVMVTSRVPLHVSGEQVYPVPPLATPPDEPSPLAQDVRTVESVRLLVERARSVRPEFQLTDENAAVVAEICRRLDGLPLAIELAASRMTVLSPEAILKRLGQRLALLTGGAADAPARQRTLRATIAWSYELLPPSERELLSRCAVFSGGFGLDGAQAVAPDGESEVALLERLGVLVDHNLVTASVGSDEEPRFGILETIREFAVAELPAAEATAVRDRHADYCIELAESAEARLQGFEHARWLGRLIEDLDNIRLARAWLSGRDDDERLARLIAAMGTYWRYYGSISEGRAWLGEALERSREASPAARAAVMMNAGWLEAVWGDLSRGKDLLEQALVLYEEVDDRRRVADVVERERLQVQIQVDRFRRGARSTRTDHVDRVERLQRIDRALRLVGLNVRHK